MSEVIREHAMVKVNGKTRLLHLIDRLYKIDPKTYLAHGWGKPVETVELQGDQENPVEFIIRLREADLP